MIEFKDVSLSFPGEKVLDSFSFAIEKGDKVVFQGPSGKGKSTILNLILGFIKPDEGQIIYDGHIVTNSNIQKLRSECSWLPQDFQLGEGIVRNVIYQPFEFKKNYNLKPGIERVVKVFESLGLARNLLEKKFTAISEGQKQRVGLAICHLLDRKLILLDEPTSSLDPKSKSMAIDLFLKKSEATVISTSHDPEWVEHCNKIIPLN